MSAGFKKHQYSFKVEVLRVYSCKVSALVLHLVFNRNSSIRSVFSILLLNCWTERNGQLMLKVAIAESRCVNRRDVEFLQLQAEDTTHEKMLGEVLVECQQGIMRIRLLTGSPVEAKNPKMKLKLEKGTLMPNGRNLHEQVWLLVSNL